MPRLATALPLLFFLWSGFSSPLGADQPEIGLRLSPDRIELDRPEASQQVLVAKALKPQGAADRTVDLTHGTRFEVNPPQIAAVDPSGLVRPLADGAAELIASGDSWQLRVPILVRAFASPPPISFRNEILPLLTKAQCNSGGCHGKAEGQNGFKLSVFGFDPQSDHRAITQESRGRRVSPADPARSLLYLKGLALVPHGGGMKIEPGSYRDQRLLRWLAEGAAAITPDDEASATVAIEVEPKQQVLGLGATQQLRVTAIDASGRRRCVTAESEYESNAPAIAAVDPRGLVRASDAAGEAAILVRYAGQLAVCRVTLPREGVTVDPIPQHNFVDRLVWEKLQRLGIRPSPLGDDATFLRRVFLDTIGTLPRPDEIRAFLADPAPDKRAVMIDRLLDRPEYADYWTMKWLNLLKADPLTVSPQGTVAMQRWLHASFAQNKPFDQLVTELLTVQGNTSEVGPGAFYKASSKPVDVARSLSQLLLGVRIECAECHHHPSERWGQDDFVGLAGFFTGIKLKKLPNGEDAIVSRGGSDLPHPRTGEVIPARALGAGAADFKQAADRRREFAAWVTRPDNPFFAKATVNRLWAHYFGRGLVDPIDDLRDTNPAANEPLMLALENHLREVGYDLKAFTRTLLHSRVYQLSDEVDETSANDVQNFSHALVKTLPAEVLLDAICHATEVPEKFNGWPAGHRAIEVWDSRMPSYFFTIFGRPVRATVCECERSDEPSISQALHLLNSPEIEAKIAHRHGRARRLAESSLSPQGIVEELYLATLGRLPTEAETARMLEAFAPGSDSGDGAAAGRGGRGADVMARSAAAEDVLWTLLNSKEFLFNH